MLGNILRFFVLVVACSLLEQVYSCSCMQGHAQVNFCSADAVFKGKVTSEQVILGKRGISEFVRSRIYGLELLGVYRNETGEDLREGDEIEVRTAGSGATCGITLTEGEKYYLSAHRWKNTFYVGLCGMHTTSLTQLEMDGIVNGRFDCNCKINNGWPRIPRDEENLTCALAMLRGGYDYRCLMNYAVCRFNEQSKSCSWEADESQEACQRFNLPPRP